MGIIFKMAYRNVIMHKKQSIFIGTTIMIAMLLMLVCNAVVNGAEKQIYNNYLNIQGGQVVAYWKVAAEGSTMSPTKLLYLSRASFDVEESYDNRKAIRELKSFVSEHSDQIEKVFYNIRGPLTVENKRIGDDCTMYGVDEEDIQWFVDHKCFQISEGSLISEKGICLSQQKADYYKVGVGDNVTIKTTDIDGIERSAVVKVTGIYEDKADYENYYVLVDKNFAREMMGYSREEFDIVRFYLNDAGSINSFAKALDNRLKEHSDVLWAQSYEEVSVFYTRFMGIMKLFYNVFFIFLLFIIAIGLKTTMRMNLFSRMAEFGTLRAIGYNKRKCYGVIFLEAFILAGISAGISLVVVLTLVGFFSRNGIYVGTGAVTYMFGGTSFYPYLKNEDIVISVAVILIFSLLATFNPGLRLLYQRITDIMQKRQKKISIWSYLIKDIFSGIRRIKSKEPETKESV